MNYDGLKPIINGTSLPASVITCDVNFEDLDSENSLRDVKTGVMHRDRIRADTLKLTIGCGIEDTSTIATLLNLLSAESFTVSFPDLHTSAGTRKNYTMYCNKKSMGLINNGKVWIKGMKFDLVEC